MPATIELDIPETLDERIEAGRRWKIDVRRGDFEDLKAEVARLSGLLERVANLAAGTQQRQVEMRADLMKAGAFRDKDPLIIGVRPN